RYAIFFDKRLTVETKTGTIDPLKEDIYVLRRTYDGSANVDQI
ncbi:hypothetical protein HMPREF9478_00341, partial [Enterococcus saccharolyticus 30_1]